MLWGRVQVVTWRALVMLVRAETWLVLVMLEPEDAPPLFLELFKDFEFTDTELQALNAVCKQTTLTF